MKIRLEVWGDNAMFGGVNHSDRYSYPVITPSAAKGILDSIFWHPGCKWRVEKIHVLSPIKYETIRTNELKGNISARKAQQIMRTGTGTFTLQDVDQRSSTLLKDVHYLLEADLQIASWVPEEKKKHYETMACNRMKNGKSRKSPCLGQREYRCNFRFPEARDTKFPVPKEYQGQTINLGMMTYGFNYDDHASLMLYNPIMINGVIDVPDPDDGDRVYTTNRRKGEM